MWEPTGRCTEDGGGGKDEVNVLESNNQHVDVFTGWPSYMGATGQRRLLGLKDAMGAMDRDTTAPSC